MLAMSVGNNYSSSGVVDVVFDCRLNTSVDGIVLPRRFKTIDFDTSNRSIEHVFGGCLARNPHAPYVRQFVEPANIWGSIESLA